MAGENEMKIIFSAETAPLESQVSKASDTVEKFGDTVKKAAQDADKGFQQINKSIKGLPEAFDKVATGSIVLTKIATNLDAAGQAAIDSSKQFRALEGAPLQTIQKLDDAIKLVKNTLANGFKANIDTSGLSPQVFSNVSTQVEGLQKDVLQLALTLNEAAIAAKGLGSSFDKGFQSGITEELQRAGVSVAEFRNALASLTGTGGANLTPLLTALDSIQAESTGTTNAIKSIGGALQGVSVLAKAPINDLVKLDQELKVIKSTLASGFKPSIEKINLQPADFTGIQTEINQANESVESFGNQVRQTVAQSIKSIDGLKNVAASIPASFEAAEKSATGLNKIGQSIESAGDAAAKGAKDFQKLGQVPISELKGLDAQLKKVKATLASGFKISLQPQEITKLSNETKNLAANTSKLKSNASGASGTLTDLTRVVQDMPFGFIGIQNNLGPLLDSFGRLKRESGSTGSAIKSLASSMMGAGGIGFAFAAVSALVTSAIQKYGSVNAAVQALFGNTNALAQAQKQLNESYAQSTASVAGETAKLKALSAIVQDETRSRTSRLNALKELQKEYPGVFSNYDLEKKGIVGIKKATDDLSASLVRRSKIAGAQALITKLTEKQLEDSLKSMSESASFGDEVKAAFQSILGVFNQSTFAAEQAARANVLGFKRQGKEATETQKQIDLVTESLNKLLSTSSEQGDFEINATVKGLDKQDAQLKSLKAELEVLKSQYEKINKLRAAGVLPKFREDDAEQISKQILDVLQKIDAREVEIKLKPKLEIDPELNDLEIDKIEADANKRLAFTKMQAPLSLIVDTKGVISQVQQAANEALTKAGVQEFQSPAAVLNVDPKAFETTHKKFEEAGKQSAAAYNEGIRAELGKSIGEVLAGSVEAAFVTLGEGLAAVFSGGGLAKAAEGFLDLIGGVLQEVGKQIILASALVQSLKKALLSLFTNPAASLAVGVGLIALGGILKSIKLDKPTKFAEGGIVTGPTVGMVGEAGPEMIIPLSRANQFLDNNEGRGFVAETAIRGRDLMLMIRREIAAQGRTGGLSLG
jgi:citrate lyase gamma subunit